MIKVAFNAMALRGNLTGLGHYSWQLAKALHSTGSCDLNYFYGQEWSKILKVNKVGPLFKYREYIRDNIPYSYQLARNYAQRNFSASLGNTNANIYHEPNYLAYKTNLPTVITVHDLSWIKYPEMHPKSRVDALNTYFSASIKQAEYVVTDSLFIKQEFVNMFDFPEHKVIPIPLGFEKDLVPLFETDVTNTLKKHNLAYKKFILCVGTLEPRKNLQVAIKAYSLLPKEIRKKFKLVLVGMKGWLYSDIEKTLKKLIDEGEVVHLGYLSREDLRAILSSAKTLVFPSVYEGFGLPPLEAMACGTPVIASNASCVPEVVGNAGILLDPLDTSGFKNAMMSIIENNILSDELSAKSIVRSKEFSWEKCASETFAIYQKLI